MTGPSSPRNKSRPKYDREQPPQSALPPERINFVYMLTLPLAKELKKAAMEIRTDVLHFPTHERKKNPPCASES